MGLDMYVYQASKIEDEELNVLRNKATDELEDERIFYLTKDEIEKDNTYNYKSLLPYMSLIDIKHRYIDWDTIFKKHNMSEEDGWHWASMGKDGIKFVKGEDYSDANTILVSTDEIDRNTFDKLEPTYVCKLEKVAYWRKAYDIESRFYNIIEGRVENCGYYPLAAADLDYMKQKAQQDRDKLNPNDSWDVEGVPTQSEVDEIPVGDDLFYHEWY